MNITAPVLSYLQNPDKTLPMLLIEGPTTIGRTYEGYKKRGKSEGREKLCEETLGAVVWLFGIKTFNKIFDVIGTKLLGLKDLDIDVGKDSLRNPFANVQHKRGLTAAYKFSKIATSVVLGTLAMGMVVPKFKQAMTNAFRMQSGLEPIPDRKSPDGKYHPGFADKVVSKFIKYDYNPDNNSSDGSNKPVVKFAPSMDDFIKQTSNSLSFTGGGALNAVLYASHNLENNTAWRLMSTDVGTLAGRVTNSRNKKEAIEYGVRDSISSLFYIFAAPLTSMAIRKAAKIPDINPKSALLEADKIKEIINSSGGKVSQGELSGALTSELHQKDLVKNLTFDSNGVITLDEFNAQTLGIYKDKADLMSKLQPKLMRNGVKTSILSERQAADIISLSPTSDPEFLKKAISLATDGKSDSERAFVSRKRLEKIRAGFDGYVQSLDDYAAKKNITEIDTELVDKFTKHLNRKNLAVHLAGYAAAVLGLAYLIPKFQYYISDKITGTSQSPSTLESDTAAV